LAKALAQVQVPLLANADILKFLINCQLDELEEAKKNVGVVNDAERVIMSDVLALADFYGMNSTNPDVDDKYAFLSEFLSGAHLALQDGRRYYYKWGRLKGAHFRPSSHASDKPEFGIEGRFVHEALIGQFQGQTWIQLERHSVDLSQAPGHALDYVKYTQSGKNQGPYGESGIADKFPLFVPTRHADTLPGDDPT
jgi:hypothetical protein